MFGAVRFSQIFRFHKEPRGVEVVEPPISCGRDFDFGIAAGRSPIEGDDNPLHVAA
jgi:hypothetical protein